LSLHYTAVKKRGGGRSKKGAWQPEKKYQAKKNKIFRKRDVWVAAKMWLAVGEGQKNGKKKVLDYITKKEWGEQRGQHTRTGTTKLPTSVAQIQHNRREQNPQLNKKKIREKRGKAHKRDQ